MAKNRIFVDGDLLAFPSASVAEERVYLAKDPDGNVIAEFPSAAHYKNWIELSEAFGADLEYGWDGDMSDLTREFLVRPKSLDHAKKAFKNTLEEWLSACPDGEVVVYMAPMSGQTNFRHDVALRKPYKGNRKNSHKPHYLQELREWAFTLPYTKRATKFESDDLVAGMARKYGENGYAISNEKDCLSTIGCWVYYPDLHDTPVWSDPNNLGYIEDLGNKLTGIGALHLMYQVIAGDSADNYSGLDGVGGKKALEVLSPYNMKSMDNLPDLVISVASLYKDKYGDEYAFKNKDGQEDVASWYDFYVESVRLAYMLKNRKDYPHEFINPAKELL